MVTVFVCGSDSRIDILERTAGGPEVLASMSLSAVCRDQLMQSRAASRHACPRPPSDWRRELRQQLTQLAHDHLILLLDDFLIQAPVNQDRLARLVEIAVRMNLDYLRLIPMGRSLRWAVLGYATC